MSYVLYRQRGQRLSNTTLAVNCKTDPYHFVRSMTNTERGREERKKYIFPFNRQHVHTNDRIFQFSTSSPLRPLRIRTSYHFPVRILHPYRNDYHFSIRFAFYLGIIATNRRVWLRSIQWSVTSLPLSLFSIAFLTMANNPLLMMMVHGEHDHIQ